jgi:hypothetical protein
MTISVTTSDVHSISREFRDLKLGQFTDRTAPTVACPDVESSPEIY